MSQTVTIPAGQTRGIAPGAAGDLLVTVVSGAVRYATGREVRPTDTQLTAGATLQLVGDMSFKADVDASLAVQPRSAAGSASVVQAVGSPAAGAAPGTYVELSPTTGAPLAIWAIANAGDVPLLVARLSQGKGNLPDTAKYQTYNRGLVGGSDLVCPSGTLMCLDIGELVAGDPLGTVALFSGSQAAVTPAHSWCAILDKVTRAVIAKTNDDATAWGGTSKKSAWSFGGASVPETKDYYLGVVQDAATPANLRGIQCNNATRDELPRVVCTSSTGLHVPGDLGATAAAFAAVGTGSGWPYAAIF